MDTKPNCSLLRCLDRLQQLSLLEDFPLQHMISANHRSGQGKQDGRISPKVHEQSTWASAK